MSHLLESLFIMDGDDIKPIIDGKKIIARNSGGAYYFRHYHNGLRGVLHANSDMFFDNNTGLITFAENGVSCLSFKNDRLFDELKLALSDQIGNQMIITNLACVTKDHDIALQTDPLFGLFSDTDPDTDNTQNILFWHDKTDGNCQVNKGEMNFDIYDGLLNIKRRSDANDVLILGHDGTNGKADTQTGQLKLRAASDVVIKRGTAAINGAMATDEIMFYFTGATPGDVYLNYYDGAAWQTKNLTA